MESSDCVCAYQRSESSSTPRSRPGAAAAEGEKTAAASAAASRRWAFTSAPFVRFVMRRHCGGKARVKLEDQRAVAQAAVHPDRLVHANRRRVLGTDEE